MTKLGQVVFISQPLLPISLNCVATDNRISSVSTLPKQQMFQVTHGNGSHQATQRSSSEFYDPLELIISFQLKPAASITSQFTNKLPVQLKDTELVSIACNQETVIDTQYYIYFKMKLNCKAGMARTFRVIGNTRTKSLRIQNTYLSLPWV